MVSLPLCGVGVQGNGGRAEAVGAQGRVFEQEGEPVGVAPLIAPEGVTALSKVGERAQQVVHQVHGGTGQVVALQGVDGYGIRQVLFHQGGEAHRYFGGGVEGPHGLDPQFHGAVLQMAEQRDDRCQPPAVVALVHPLGGVPGERDEGAPPHIVLGLGHLQPDTVGLGGAQGVVVPGPPHGVVEAGGPGGRGLDAESLCGGDVAVGRGPPAGGGHPAR